MSFRCIYCRSDGEVFWCDLKLLTMCVGPGASCEGLQGRIGSVPTFSLIDWDMYKGQSDLWLGATCTGLGGTWVWLRCKLKLVAAWEFLMCTTVWAEASHLFCQACSHLAEAIQAQTGCCLCQVWGHQLRLVMGLSKSYNIHRAGRCLFGVCGPLKDVGKVLSTNLGRLLVWRSIEETVARWSNWVSRL